MTIPLWVGVLTVATVFVVVAAMILSSGDDDDNGDGYGP